MKSVILAGGLGTRLQPYTTFLPKPMLPLGEKPILEHLIDWNKKNGIKDIVLCVSYLKKTIQDYFEDGNRFGIKIQYAVSDRPLATAGQLKTAQKYIDDTFVCMYGDSIFDLNLKKMIVQHKKKRSFVTMGLYQYKTNLPYGVIQTKPNGTVTGWQEKPETQSNINIGCYVMEPQIFEYIPNKKSYGMDGVVQKAIAKKKLVSSYTARGFTDIGDKESYKKASQKFLEKLGKI